MTHRDRAGDPPVASDKDCRGRRPSHPRRNLVGIPGRPPTTGCNLGPQFAEIGRRRVPRLVIHTCPVDIFDYLYETALGA